jgi:hypothetical protein
MSGEDRNPPPTADDSPHGIEWVDRLSAAAIEAEYETGRREETPEEARRGVVMRLVRMVAGFTIIGVGLAGLVLPGPGWALIIFGLMLLPFAWAERTVLLIRRKVPGVPEEGNLPLSTWIIMGVALVVFTGLSLKFGSDVSSWLASLWGDPDRLLG